MDDTVPLTRPAGTLSPSEGEREGVRGRSMESLHDPEIAHCDHEPIRVRNAGFIRQCSAGVSLLPDESGVPMRRFMEIGVRLIRPLQ